MHERDNLVYLFILSRDLSTLLQMKGVFYCQAGLHETYGSQGNGYHPYFSMKKLCLAIILNFSNHFTALIPEVKFCRLWYE